MGLLITMETLPPRCEKKEQAPGSTNSWETKHPKLQIHTVGELLEGKTIDAPPSRDIRTFKKRAAGKAQVERESARDV